MISISYNVESIADEAYDLFVLGISELERTHNTRILPDVEIDRTKKRITLFGFKNRMDEDLSTECRNRFTKSFKVGGMDAAPVL